MTEVKSKSDNKSIAKKLGCMNPDKVSLKLTETDCYPLPSKGIITVDCFSCSLELEECAFVGNKPKTYTFTNFNPKPKVEKCDPDNCPYDIPCKECPRRDT